MKRISASIVLLASAVFFLGATVAVENIFLRWTGFIAGLFLFIDGMAGLVKSDKAEKKAEDTSI